MLLYLRLIILMVLSIFVIVAAIYISCLFKYILCVSFSFRSTVQRLPSRPQNYSHYTVSNRIGMLHFMYELCFHDNVHFHSCLRIRTRERVRKFLTQRILFTDIHHNWIKKRRVVCWWSCNEVQETQCHNGHKAGHKLKSNLSLILYIWSCIPF